MKHPDQRGNIDPTKFLKTHKLLLGSIILTIALGVWVGLTNKTLETPQAPNGIISLELVWNQDKAVLIQQSWLRDVKCMPMKSIAIDYLFIFAYTFFLVRLVKLKDNGSTINGVFFSLSIAAGVLDVVENVFMMLFLENVNVPFFLFSVPATIKFALITAVIIYLLYFSEFLSNLLKAVRLYLAGILTVVITYFILIKLTQGQDIVMQIAEFSGPFGWTTFCVLLWSVYIWYSSRLVGYAKELKQPGYLPDSFNLHVPRLLSWNALVSIQTAIIALPTVAKTPEFCVWIFVILQNGLYFVWTDLLTDRIFKYSALTSIITAVAYSGWLVFLVFWPAVHESKSLLPLIAIMLFAFQLILAWLFIERRKIIDKPGPTGKIKLTILNKELIQIPQKFTTKEQPFFQKFNLLAIAGIALYFFGFFSLWLTNLMGPLAFTLLAFGVLTGLSNIITFLSINNKGINFFFFLLLLAAILGLVYDQYPVRLIKATKQNFYASRPDLETYFRYWVECREDKINATTNFPVYLVISDGGASRSGYWVASVLAALQDTSIIKNPQNKFSDHLLCLAGASGGSVGTATFYALLRNKPKDDTTTYLKYSRAFLKQDFLTPVITRWLGSDIIQHVIPLPVSDRAGALEKSMEHFAKDSLFDSFAQPVSDMIDKSGKLPILFINTTHLEQGNPAVVSSIRLGGFSERIDVLDHVEKTKGTIAKGDILYSTAVVLGARFPFVSPAGHIGRENFVDGGYFDNTGAGIVHEMMQKIESIIKTENDSSRKALYSRLCFTLLHISNTSVKQESEKTLHPLVDDFAAPILTVLNTYSSQTTVNDHRLKTFMSRLQGGPSHVEINLYKDKSTADYPMNWVISNYNLNRMDQRLEEIKKEKFFSELY